MVLLALAGSIHAPIARGAEPESFLLITIDTLRADHVGAYGYARRVTPALDRLARRGVVFKNAFCVMPTTVPSHGSLFFSTWPRIHGSTSNFLRFSNSGLTFLPDVLESAGYAVGAVVSASHLRDAFRRFSSFRRIDSPERARTADATLQAARGWLDRNAQSKFFLWIHLWDPHSPYEPHAEFMKEIDPGARLDFERHYAFTNGRTYTPDQVRTMIDLYDNEIAYADHHLGLFLEEFRRRPYAKHTTIIVTADHGETLDELLKTEGYGFDHGEYLYDHQLRVPLIIVTPDATRRGRVVGAATSLLDVMPTVLERAGLPLPPSAQGRSLSSSMDSASGGRGRESVVFLERRDFTSPPIPSLAGRQFGIRDRDYKLLYDETTRRTVLYRNDREGADLSGRDERVTRLMMQRLRSWLELTAQLSAGAGPATSEEETQSLRALGYVR